MTVKVLFLRRYLMPSILKSDLALGRTNKNLCQVANFISTILAEENPDRNSIFLKDLPSAKYFKNRRPNEPTKPIRTRRLQS